MVGVLLQVGDEWLGVAAAAPPLVGTRIRVRPGLTADGKPATVEVTGHAWELDGPVAADPNPRFVVRVSTQPARQSGG